MEIKSIYGGLLLGLFTLTANAQLTATFIQGTATDVRMDRLPTLQLAENEAPTPFLKPGAFQVTWTGKIVVPRRQRLVFSCEGQGTVSLSIGGKEILSAMELPGKPSESTRLNPGEHEISISYTRPATGAASLRVFWEEAAFPRQTIPPTAFKTSPTDATNLAALQRRGRSLFASQNCVKCHASGTGLGPQAMPELAQVSPILFGTGDRSSEDWLRRWIAEPHTLKPGTHMPALVDPSTPQGLQDSSDLTAFLVSLKIGNAPSPTPHDPALAKSGGVIFHELGCVGCHALPDQAASDPTRVPLNNIALKYLPGALAAYLKLPENDHPFSKMPNFHLSDTEATALAAYLTEASKGHETRLAHTFPTGDSARGAKLAESLQCGVCHPGMPQSPATAPASLEAVFQKDWSALGCVSPPENRGKSPRLNLSPDDRLALIAFSKMGSTSLAQDNPAEFTLRQVDALRCTACHAMDAQNSLLDDLHRQSAPLTAHLPRLNDRLDQSRPALTFLGEMLTTATIESTLAGTLPQRARPWLGMRMPAFKNYATSLAHGFSKLHGFSPDPAPAFVIDPAKAEIGKTLVGSTGFGCTTCHGVGDQKPTAAFEVQGIQLDLGHSRLRPDYFRRWMENPASITPNTKMPRYSEGQKSQRLDILDGDAAKQFDAIWHYLHQLPQSGK
jgi:cytochrome c553